MQDVNNKENLEGKGKGYSVLFTAQFSCKPKIALKIMFINF